MTRLLFIAVLATGLTACKDGNSVYDPDYEPSRPNPVVTNITPTGGYLAGVDSVIVTGENFASNVDSMTINFGGASGIIKDASPTRLVVRTGTKSGTDLDVRVSVRGAEFFSDGYPYTLTPPMDFYFGTSNENKPTSPIAIDAQNNIYTIAEITGGKLRYIRISPDGTITTDGVKYPGEPRPDVNNTSPYPTDSTMRFTEYSSILMSPNGELLMSQQGFQAIFRKTFGDDVREQVWAVSSSSALKIRDMVFDDNGFIWAVGNGTNQIHRFNYASKAETKFNFTGTLNSVAFNSVNNELYVGGTVGGTQQVWKFNIDGSGNIGSGSLYFDYGEKYAGTITSMILAANGELLITTGPELDDVDKPAIVRVYPDGKSEDLYEGMLKQGAFSVTWRDDNYAVVGVKGDAGSINYLDMFDRTRAGIYGF